MTLSLSRMGTPDKLQNFPKQINNTKFTLELDQNNTLNFELRCNHQDNRRTV